MLSSGKAIQIVHWKQAPGSRGAISSAGDLHICRSCTSPLVYPTSWEEVGECHWRLTLRCPNCERYADGVYVRSAVERFDEELTRGGLALARDLRQLAHANMEEECERFIAAVHADHVLPVDF